MKWKQEKAWRIRYESNNQDSHILWQNREEWSRFSHGSIGTWPETYADWSGKSPPSTQPRGPRSLRVTHDEPHGATDLPKQVGDTFLKKVLITPLHYSEMVENVSVTDCFS